MDAIFRQFHPKSKVKEGRIPSIEVTLPKGKGATTDGPWYLENLGTGNAFPAWGDSGNGDQGEGSYWKLASPLLWTLRINGKMSYVCKNGEVSSTKGWWLVYPIIVSAINMYLASDIVVLLYRVMAGRGYDLDSVIQSVISYMFMLHHFLAPVSILVCPSRFIKYLQMWKKFEKDMKSISGQSCDSGLLRKLYWFLGIAHVSTLGILFVEMRIYTLFKWYHIPAYVSIYTTSHVYMFIWAFTSRHIAAMAEKLKLHMEKVLKERQGADAISKGRCLWNQLSEITQYTGEIMAVTMVLTMVSFLAVLSTSSYSILVFIIEKKWSYDMIGYIMFAVYSALYLFLLSDSGDRATRHVGSLFGSELLKIDLSLLDEESKIQMVEFTNTILVNYPKIYIGGFTEINRRLWTSVVATYVTYLIVLGQFKVSESNVKL